MKEIATALLKAQSEMSNPKKGRQNPFLNTKYADLNSVREAVLPVLNKYGISVIQPMVHIGGVNFVKTILLHESGEILESFTEIVYSKPNDAQSQGSGITYARRYSLQAMVCVGADDDDGHRASMPNEKAGRTLVAACTKEILGVTCREELEKVWKKYPAMHKEPSFIDASVLGGKKFPKA